jgi:transposase InsO family protein
MSKPRVIVLSVVEQGLTATQAAAKFGVSRQWVHQLLHRYRDGGLDAVEARSHRPRANPRQTPPQLAEQIIALRQALTTQGLDAGPLTIAWHLRNENLPVPSTSTIRRILHTAGLVTPAPKKRPRSSYRRFQAAQPNECWQSDFTHWALADGTDVEILNWLDDHSRYLLAITAFTHVTGGHVVTTFLHAIVENGYPVSTLTDNGLVYTARFRHGRNAFEYLLADLGITQKNRHPGHPQTQGKIERFHQTLKRWLAQQPPAATITELQHPSRETPPPRHRHLPRQHPDPDAHRPRHRQRHQPRHRPTPGQPHHRPRPQLLAKQQKRPRPMARAHTVMNHATHQSTITQLTT